MKQLLEAAGRAFLLAFGATYATYAAGIFEAPNTAAALTLAVAALGASFSGALGAIKEYVPQFSWATILPDRVPAAWVSRLDVFTITAVGVLIVAITNIITESPDLTLWPALITSAIAGAIAAGFRSAVGATTKGETPFSGSGLEVNEPKPAQAPPA